MNIALLKLHQVYFLSMSEYLGYVARKIKRVGPEMRGVAKIKKMLTNRERGEESDAHLVYKLEGEGGHILVQV